MLIMEKKDILVLGEGPAYGFDDARITAEPKYSLNITKSKQKFCVYIAMEVRVFYMLVK